MIQSCHSRWSASGFCTSIRAFWVGALSRQVAVSSFYTYKIWSLACKMMFQAHPPAKSYCNRQKRGADRCLARYCDLELLLLVCLCFLCLDNSLSLSCNLAYCFRWGILNAWAVNWSRLCQLKVTGSGLNHSSVADLESCCPNLYEFFYQMAPVCCWDASICYLQSFRFWVPGRM